jgi:hypothetical protein
MVSTSNANAIVIDAHSDTLSAVLFHHSNSAPATCVSDGRQACNNIRGPCLL